MNKVLLVTGGAGFIGSNFIKLVLRKRQDIDIINFDALTYAGNLDNLQDIASNPRYQFIKGDITDVKAVKKALKNVDYLVHFAAESHVDRSIEGPEIFIKTNILGTQVLLEQALKIDIKKFIHVSTDEVYGSLGKTGYFTEDTSLAPNSPYSASKASSDLLARAYFKTFDLPVIITRCSNNYGPYQFPEKLIPLMIKNALSNKKLPVYGDGKNIRDWLFVQDHAEAVYAVLQDGKPGSIYNIGGNNEWQNIDIVKLILKELNKSFDLIEFVKDRLGHDRRYAIDSSKIKQELNWQAKTDFETGIKTTIKWYLNNEAWLSRIETGAYTNYN